MKVIPCGSKIKATLSNIEGIITAVCIRFNAVNYEVSYFAGQEYKQIWLNENEFESYSKKKSIGFINNKHDNT